MVLGLQPLATLILLRQHSSNIDEKKPLSSNTSSIRVHLFVIDLFHDLNKYNLKLYLVIRH